MRWAIAAVQTSGQPNRDGRRGGLAGTRSSAARIVQRASNSAAALSRSTAISVPPICRS